MTPLRLQAAALAIIVYLLQLCSANSSQLIPSFASSGPRQRAKARSTPRRRAWTDLKARTAVSPIEGERVRVGIIGAGSIAFGTAALLSQSGHDPMLWSPSETGTSDLTDTPLVTKGAIEITFHPRIASSASHLVNDNDVLLLALPANGHKTVMNSVAPHIRSDQHVLISSHASLGAVYLTQLLRERDILAPITAWGTTVVTGRRTSGTEVQVNTVRDLVDICTVPAAQSSAGLKLCRNLFGERFRPRDGLLAISLSNLNPQNHLGIALGNMARMERGERWSQGLNVTPNIGRFLEALDRERIDIADALGLEVRTIYEHFHLSFHVPVASISEMNQQIHEVGNDVNGPDTAESRYVTEDAPYGLALTVALGNMVGRPAVLHEAGMRILSAMYGRDFEGENDLIEALDLKGVGMEQLKEAGHTGLLHRHDELAE